MKYLFTIIMTLFFSIVINAQTVFKHIVTKKNTKGHITSINHKSTNNLKNKVLFVTHDYGKTGPYQTKAVGVWYNGKNWTIFNQDKSPLKVNTKFNVMVVNKSTTAFTAKANRGGKLVLTHPKLKGNSNASFLVTQNWGTKGPYNPNPIGVFYNGSYWEVFNSNGKPIPAETKFNVLIHSSIKKHKVSSKNRSKHMMHVNNTNANDFLFTTFNAQNTRKNFKNPIGVWFNGKKWTVYNENKSMLKGNEAYNIYTHKRSFIKPFKPGAGVLISKDIKTKPKGDTKGLKNIGLVKYYPIKPIVVGTTTGTTSTERTGPDLLKYEDVESLLEEDKYTSFLEKLNIFKKIYKDKNANSNVYYYFPAEYTLQWEQETNEYAFNIYYMSADEEGNGSVLIKAHLTPRISSDDINLAEQFLTSKLRKTVKLMPMDLRDVPKVNFGAALSNFNVKEESINASIPSDYHKPIILDWRMDSNVNDFVGAMLDIGVDINIEFKPYGDESTIINVPINLEVNSPSTFGKIAFETTTELANGWTNIIDYPITPKEIVVLYTSGRKKLLKTIPLEGSEVLTGEIFTPETSAIQTLQTTQNISKIWLDYSLNANCSTCNQQVKSKIVGGTTEDERKSIEIQILNPLEYSEAHSMKLYIKSLQGDPNRISVISFPAITIAEDDQSIEGVQLFVPTDQELSYDYQVVMIMQNGEIKTSDWANSNSELLVLAENQIKSLFKKYEKSDLEKAKDAILEDKKDELIEKGKDLLEDLLKKKDDKEEETPEETPEEDTDEEEPVEENPEESIDDDAEPVDENPESNDDD